jgi:hypothetical protein
LAGVDKSSHRHIVLIRWSIISTPKQYDGLGLLNLKYMNRALLLKWWWRFSINSAQLWKSVLIAKYNFRFTGTLSFFWKSMVSLVPIMRINLKRLVGSGESILFWFNVWFGEVFFFIFCFQIYLLRTKP